MKKILLFTILMSSVFLVKGQQWKSDSGKLTTTGRVGVGTTTTYNGILTINSSEQTDLLRLENDGLGNESRIRFRSKSITGGTFHADLSLYSSVNGAGLLGFKMPHNNTPGAGFDFVVNQDGNVGIGTSNPTGKLDVLGAHVNGGENLLRLRVSDATSDYFAIRNGTGRNGQFIPVLAAHHQTDNRNAFHLSASTISAHDNGSTPLYIFDARLRNGSSQGVINNRPLFQWRNFDQTKMTMLANGNVGIGTTTTGTHKLAVDGTIAGREMTLENAAWPDYVFADEYELQSLEEVAEFIKANKHLPAVPSEAEVTESGINVSEMNATLLKKIEELTLHMIEMNNRVKQLEKENEELKK